MQEISDDLLTQSVLALSNQITAQRAEIARLGDQLQRDERELNLIRELMQVRGLPVDGVLKAQHDGGGHPSPPAPFPSSATDSGGLVDAVIEILRESKVPLHIQDLLNRVRQRDLRIPGKGEPANLIAHIRARNEIVRPARGVYGLREWGIVDYTEPRAATKPPSRRASKARRRPARNRSARTLTK